MMNCRWRATGITTPRKYGCRETKKGNERQFMESRMAGIGNFAICRGHTGRGYDRRGGAGYMDNGRGGNSGNGAAWV
eukprot:CAMPEP_0201952398 /NCGR_PEP_ID=MMETSP0904-20121228/1141_1 /ASSEMBLY_ACC=CAM_ASM_000553 /TAXON_ID=420261 /ORGANISM="Thalassiosira antarctica, Strain CCMP982" /LENGTH=76 /DNA_ID=CAMNT_0048496073 /DNA_START=635 /DNA_END=865 /DNA_ORIENTATION=-